MENLFITGGAGYLGRALLRILAKESPHIICTIFSRDHGKHARCQKEFPQHRYIIGDVRDYDSVELAMAGHRTVVHAAAFKYVPEGETNVIECHEINVLGSLNVARAAMRTGVERVVGLSTDKACQPINVYGMTKLMMERIFIEADTKSHTRFNLVRYGNVVSSTGSAIPIFRRQAKDTGVIRITNPDMTRFWLSVYDAARLIIMALNENKGKTILIPRLPSLDMMDVAKAASMLELGQNADIKFDVIGERFGEKDHEDLLGKVEAHYAEPYENSPFKYKVMRLNPMTGHPINYYTEKYTSKHPDIDLSIGEAVQMIKESPE